MPRYTFACVCGHECEEERSVARCDDPLECEGCGASMSRTFCSAVSTFVAPWNRAPGSVGSSADASDRQARYLNSEGYRKKREFYEQKGGVVKLGNEV